MLQAQGKRKNGRWERGSVTNVTDGSDGDRVQMVKAGLILDTAIRAVALGDDYADYIDLPAQVMSLGMTLDYAYRMAEAFEGKAALAEMMRREPFAKAVAQADAIVDELAKQLPPPAIDVPLTKADRAQLNNLAKRLRDLAAKTAAYAKESK